MVKVLTTHDKNIEGKLLSVSQVLTIEEQEIQKHKIVSTKQVEIPITEIKKIVVLVSFN